MIEKKVSWSTDFEDNFSFSENVLALFWLILLGVIFFSGISVLLFVFLKLSELIE
jgi:hypothetical protein